MNFRFTRVFYRLETSKFLSKGFMQKWVRENYQRYYDAAAALSLLCYKANLEMMHRTGNLAGYQMLDIQDFPVRDLPLWVF